MFKLTPVSVSRYLRSRTTVEACNRSIARLTLLMVASSNEIAFCRLRALQTAVGAKRTTLELKAMGVPEVRCGASIGRMVESARAAWGS